MRKLLLLGALSAALLAGCSNVGGPPPLGNGDGGGRSCSPAPQAGRPVDMGLSELDNQGAAPVTIRSVSLTNAVGMGSTDDAWLVPVNANGPQLGLGQAYPPATYPLWPRRVPAVGAVIQPGQRQQLVFGVYRTTAADATSDGPTVVYTAGHASYTLHEGFSLALARARCFLSSLP